MVAFDPGDRFVAIGRDHDLPVVVDAASELPPVENLHKFLDLGADVVCFSGGKAIKAPNNTGMLLGRGRGAEIVRAVREHSFPHYGWARGHKISKEQIVGLVVALEIFVEEGDRLYAEQMGLAEKLREDLSGIAGVEVTIIPNDETLHEHPMMPHVPRVLVEWDAQELGLTAAEVDERMAGEDPPVFLRDVHYFDYYTNKQWRLIDTFFLRPPEPEILAERLRRILTEQAR